MVKGKRFLWPKCLPAVNDWTPLGPAHNAVDHPSEQWHREDNLMMEIALLQTFSVFGCGSLICSSAFFSFHNSRFSNVLPGALPH